MENLPSISVCIPVHSGTNKDDLVECVQSLVNQKYQDFEIVIISESQDLSDYIDNKFKSESVVKIYNITNDGGLSVARNKGIQYSNGDVIAYIDADATADHDWLSELSRIYVDENAIAVGGKAIADWVCNKRPRHIPEEFLWLVGVTHKNHDPHGTIVRSTFGCNMSFEKNVLKEIGGFKKNIGKDHGYNLQGEEQDVGIRIKNKFDKGMYYNENAVVHHKVDSNQLSGKWLSKRAYLQGVSKRIIKNETETELQEEQGYLVSILNSCLHYSYMTIFKPNKLNSIFAIFFILYYTFLVGIGYILAPTLENT